MSKTLIIFSAVLLAVGLSDGLPPVPKAVMACTEIMVKSRAECNLKIMAKHHNSELFKNIKQCEMKKDMECLIKDMKKAECCIFCEEFDCMEKQIKVINYS